MYFHETNSKHRVACGSGKSPLAHGCKCLHEMTGPATDLAFRRYPRAAKITPPPSRSANGVSTPLPPRQDSVSSASTTVMSGSRALPPVLGRLLSGTFWLALRVPLQVVFSLWSTRLILETIKADQMGAYRFAWGFGFFQMLFEFGISSALQRQISNSWTRGDKEGVDRAVACGLNFYTAMAVVQMIALLAVTYWALPRTAFHGESYDLIVKLLWLQIVTAPCYGLSVVVSSVLQAARRYDLIPRLEVAITILRFVVLVAGLKVMLVAGLKRVDFFWVVVAQIAIQVCLSLGPGLWVMIYDLGHLPNLRRAR